jgi:hypothetical protein
MYNFDSKVMFLSCICRNTSDFRAQSDVNRANWFADTYLKGLDDAGAVYNAEKYMSHRNMPPGYEE